MRAFAAQRAVAGVAVDSTSAASVGMEVRRVTSRRTASR